MIDAEADLGGLHRRQARDAVGAQGLAGLGAQRSQAGQHHLALEALDRAGGALEVEAGNVEHAVAGGGRGGPVDLAPEVGVAGGRPADGRGQR